MKSAVTSARFAASVAAWTKRSDGIAHFHGVTGRSLGGGLRDPVVQPAADLAGRDSIFCAFRNGDLDYRLGSAPHALKG